MDLMGSSAISISEPHTRLVASVLPHNMKTLCIFCAALVCNKECRLQAVHLDCGHARTWLCVYMACIRMDTFIHTVDTPGKPPKRLFCTKATRGPPTYIYILHTCRILQVLHAKYTPLKHITCSTRMHYVRCMLSLHALHVLHPFHCVVVHCIVLGQVPRIALRCVALRCFAKHTCT